ncbi:MAG: DUF4430 domain-containing protein [Acholeplasma sp.]|nr:MAG: DUF4430 domain-containing protein [Acholeplasma sp.]
MKKVWLTGLILLSFVLLAGCQEDNLEVPRGTLDVEVVDLLGTQVFFETITYDLTTEESVFDLIDQAIDLDYSVFDIGTMINGIEGFYPTEYGITYNYWYSLYIDDEMSNVGIEDIELSDGLKISFKESTMLDEIDLWVDEVIYAFIEQHASDYINENAASYHVVAALKQLSDRGYDIPELNDQNYDYPGLMDDTIASLFKSSVIAQAFGLQTSTLETAIVSMIPANHYESVSFMNAYHLLGMEVTSTMIDELTQSTPAYMDADYAGMVLNALSPYGSNMEVESFVNEMLVYIGDQLTSSGIESWGNPNASSTAAVVLGLIAQGINPRGTEYTLDNTDLIEALKLYEVDRTFKYLLADENADLAFSTPQVFSALVAYKLYRDVWGNPAVNLFIPYQ